MAQKIMVVDDTVDSRDLLHLYLTTAGFAVIIAADGGEGLYHAKSERPDLIITDINMPNLDGVSMIKELRAEPGTAATPVIAMTAYGREFREAAVDAGANATMEKPFNFEELIKEVRSRPSGSPPTSTCRRRARPSAGQTSCRRLPRRDGFQVLGLR